MKRSILAVGLAVAFVALASFASSSRAGELGFEEDFALAPDRTVPLKQLIPGTPDYYYYNCLNFQNQKKLPQVDELLAAWIKQHGRGDGRIDEIEYRQALLVYDTDAPRSLGFIKTHLNLYFNHEKETVERQQALPTVLDPKLIARDTLTKRALANHANTLGGFENSALDWLMADAKTLSEERVHELLSRLTRPDYPNLVQLILADRATRRYQTTFGTMNIHRQLLLGQLDEMIKTAPELLSESQFVDIYLTKLRPSVDIDWQHDPKAHAAYLDRLWAFVSTLPPVHNSLKANVLYQRLVLDRSQGIWDKDRFLAYLKLPRQVFYINPLYLQRRENRDVVANLSADFSAADYLPPIRIDEPVVRSYLLHFFVDADSYDAYKPYVENNYLKNLFAEAKLTNGVGDPEKWYPLLTPEQLQTLKERIDIDFAYTNKDLFNPGDAVSLDLDVKNAPTLIVKVFEINTPSFYETTHREVDTDINLDGLVANEEKVYTYTDPAIRRLPRHFDFPTLKDRGVYIVEFIGNGKSSRALIRKGKLRYLEHVGAAGQVFTVLDEANKPLPTATLWLAGKEFDPDKDGNILVPFSTNPGAQPIILQTADGFASLDSFSHQAENYAFTAGIYVDRATLIKGGTSAVIIRPGLTVDGQPVSASLLEEATLVITSVDRDGVPTAKEVPDFKLLNDKDSVYAFQVPDRLASVTFTLRAKVQSLSLSKKIDLATSSTFQLNGIDATDKIEDLFFGHIDGQYVIDVRGKTGEIRPDQPVNLSLKQRDFNEPVVVTLKSDAHGRIKLGDLPDIATLTATGPEGVGHTWSPLRDRITRLHSVDAAVGQAIRIPYMGLSAKPQPSELSLLELRGDANNPTFVADDFASLTIKDGYVVIPELPAGDYSLLFKDTNVEISLHIAPGVVRDGWVLGENRFLEIKDADPLQIVSATADKDNLNIQLANFGKYTRVHVIATRFVPEYSAFGSLSAVGWPEPSFVTLPRLETVYITGRDIGDEYRYIIDRKYALKFPGNMLTRPGLLLNPWAIRKTETTFQEPAPQGNFGGMGGVGGRGGGGAFGVHGEAMPQGAGWPDLDFLPAGSAVLTNLVPDAKGVITVKRADLGQNQEIHIIAIDPAATVYRELSLAETPLAPRDLRLAASLDITRHFTEQKKITLLAKGGTFTIADATGSNMEVYDSLPKAYRLFMTLSHNPTLAEFNFILDWPKLKDAEKREKYSKYACHELNYFLSKKDPDFFKAVILPYLKNKKDKTFMDRFLVNEDLHGYLEPWAYSQLNVVEQALLGQRIAAEQAAAARHVKDLYDLLPPNIDQFNYLFDTAIKAGALETLLNAKVGAGVLNLNGANTYFGGTVVTGGTLALRDGVGAGAAFGGGGGGTGGGGIQIGLADGVSSAPTAAAIPAPAMPPGNMAVARNQLEAVTRASVAGEVQAQMKAMQKSEDLAYDKDNLRREAARKVAFYQQLDKTEEWVENNYYHLPIENQSASLVTVNAFWKDFAAHVADPSFLSPDLAYANRNFTEIMFALSTLDLPFESGKNTQETKDHLVTFTAAEPAVVFHKEITETQPLPAAEKTPILVSQNYFRADDRYTYIDNERADKYVTDEFLSFVVYGCQAVVTNPTSSRQKLDLLLQIPQDSLPLANAQYTRGIHLDLNPYETKSFEYYFYFPATGSFPHYPVHVAKNEKLIAFAPATTLKVVETPTKIDTTSWAYISQNGTSEQVTKFLEDNNIDRLDLEKIAWRMKDAKFFQSILALLTQRHVYNDTLWSYGVFHNQPSAIKEFLEHSDAYLSHVGAYIDTTLLTLDPVIRKTYQFMEYAPLVNARAHKLGSKRRILNDRFYQQYEALMTVLRYRPELDNDDLMTITYYLLLQDRIADAQTFFKRVNQPTLGTQVQYDYFAAYMDFYNDTPTIARTIADKYKDYPVDRWQKLFAGVSEQLDEIQGKTPVVIDAEDRAQRMAHAAAAEASLDFKVEDGKITLNYQNLSQVTVNYYLMDIELLFSQNPFIQAYTGQFAYIKPNQTAVLKLDPARTTATFDLPENFHASNVMVQITAAGITRSQASFANTLNVQVVENFGQLKVADQKSGKPLPKVYVKTYARMNDGSVKFYKDGYTDLRGVFDYSSLSTNELDNVARFSLLILSDTQGVVVREAAPPKR